MITSIKQRLPTRITDELYRLLHKPYFKVRSFAKYGSTDMFEVIYLETITACNRRCSYCPNSISEHGLISNTKRMSRDLFCKIIDELSARRWKGDIQPHFYGEPLLDERLVEWVQYAKGKLPSSGISIFSNGDLLTVGLYKELIKAGVARFIITQHSAEKQQNVEDVITYRAAHPEYVKFEYRRLNVIWNRGGAVNVLGARQLVRCEVAPSTVGVDYQGNVLICCHDYYRSVKIGNLQAEQLFDVWAKPVYRKLRSDLRRGKYAFDICKNCSVGNSK